MTFGELTPELIPYYKFWAKVADYYDKQCTKSALTMYAQHSSDYPVEDLVRAFQKYSSDPKHAFMPKPAQIIDYLNPTLDAEAEARAIAARVVRAVSEHGWPNSSKAKVDIGPEGWAAVEGYGGWTYICENLGTKIDLGQFQAQIRGVAKAKVEQRRAGIVSPDRQLEGGGNKRLEDLVGQLSNEMRMEE